MLAVFWKTGSPGGRRVYRRVGVRSLLESWLSNSGWLTLVWSGTGTHLPADTGQANAGKTNTKGMAGSFS